MQQRIVRAAPHGWEGVEPSGYSPDAPRTGVARHTIVGSRKNDPSEPGPKMELRYFEVGPGAASRLEKHEHEHYVVVRTGLGFAVIGDEVTELAPNDVVYVGPLELHQFVNRGDVPFGFYCFVDSCRDFPQMPSERDLERLRNSPAGAVAKPNAVPAPVRR
ncbi:MAG TPA: cupin domain-containing protein [Candidatus Cybelea sp.]|nr:cupin domain-containing protein [Candidatus Cybelea sp.]